MMTNKYVLEGKTPVRVHDLMDWSQKFEIQTRRVALTEIGEASVSTVFLGVDHNFTEEGPPLLFETMIFGGRHDSYCQRYSTWDEAEIGHAEAVKLVEGLKP